jgi:Kdo2-lipid IVA lauroyltransferase/acyltransferase
MTIPIKNNRGESNRDPRDNNPDARWRWSLLAPQHWPIWLALGLFRLIEPLPYSLLMALGRGIGAVVYRLPTHFTRVARANIKLCLPALSAQEREQLVKRHFASLGMGLIETAMSWWSSNARMQKLTQLEGLDHLLKAHEQGYGVLLLSAHFNTFDIGVRALCLHYLPNIMYRPPSNKVMGYFLARNRAHHTKRAIRRDDIRTLITALKNKEAVWYAPDQAYRKKGAEMVKFFGTPCATNIATTRLAKMTGALVMPFLSERLPNNQGYKTTIYPPLQNFPSDDAIADAERYHQVIEEQIKRTPEQYLWIHRRFKGLSEEYPDYY